MMTRPAETWMILVAFGALYFGQRAIQGEIKDLRDK